VQKHLVRWREREGAAGGAFAVLVLATVSLPAHAQGYQDALGPGAESRAFGGAVSAGARGASAAFINPAGLGLAERPEVYVGLGVSGTHRQSEVEAGQGPIDSELEATPLPAFAAALPLARWLVLGVHAAPVAFQGGAYQLDPADDGVRDARTMRMFEMGPDLAIIIPDDVIPGELAFGLGYRLTFGSLSRVRAPATGPADLRLDLTGGDTTSGRLGLQYSPIPELRLGLTAQGRVSAVLGAAEGEMAGETVEGPETWWTLPTRFTAGVRGDLDRYSLALEYRYAGSGGDILYQSADESGDAPETTLGDVHSVHLGAEMRLSQADLEFPLRAGYTFESSLGSAEGLSPFDPPPSTLHTLGLGAGVAQRRWASNLALTGRFGGAGGEEFYEWSLSADFLIRFGQ
jgi:hypothetical protein